MSIALTPNIAETRTRVAEARKNNLTIGVVPTMGALHEGHGELVRRARAENGFVVVTLFVNPIQFNRREDLDRYPRDVSKDVAYCDSLGADVVFAPEVDEMYPGQLMTSVEVSGVSQYLEGEFRPGHFKGVSTVVAKLLNIVQADRAYFGEKDAQQLAVIQKMVADLNMPVTIVPVPTVREADGLALSSRNRLLSPEEREQAPVVYRALQAAQAQILSGETAKVARIAALSILAENPSMRLDYLEVVDAATMTPVDQNAQLTAPVRIAIAVWLGKTRLIDNVLAS
ncbi:MAG: pantoate--beta-alanine ligase [Acidobacteriota bacterium]